MERNAWMGRPVPRRVTGAEPSGIGTGAESRADLPQSEFAVAPHITGPRVRHQSASDLHHKLRRAFSGRTAAAIINAVTSTHDQRTRRFGTVGFSVICVAALTGYGLLVWSVYVLEWMTTELMVGGVIAAVALPAAGIAVGGAVTAGRPRDVRIFAGAAGAALGAGCLLLGSAGSFMFLLFGNV
ncbi:hypothetical protein [Nonomuraea angiospora]